jgi:acyl-CoA thioesterase
VTASSADAAPHEFDRGTTVEPVGPGAWRAVVADGWDIAGSPNGGYLLSIGLAALRYTLPHTDPLTVTGHFVARTRPGPVAIRTEVLRVGSSLSTAVARVEQEGQLRYAVTSTFGDLSTAEGPTHVTETSPDLPDPDACVPVHAGPGRPPILARFDLRLTPETVGWTAGTPSGRAEVLGWIRLADGREPDTWSMPLFADAFPPAVANVTEMTWVPTLEFTVHVRARPSPSWLRCVFRTRFLVNGYLEEDGEIWDARDRLVALSRQLARIH